MKKKTIIIISILAVLVIGLVILFKNIIPFNNGGNDGDSYDKNIKIINKFDAKIYIYNEDITFRDGVNTTKIDNFESLEDESFIIINDRSSNLFLTENDYLLLENAINNNSTIMYFGSSLIDEFISHNLVSNIASENDSYRGFSVNKIGSSVGLWTTTDEDIFTRNSELLGSTVVLEVVEKLKR